MHKQLLLTGLEETTDRETVADQYTGVKKLKTEV